MQKRLHLRGCNSLFEPNMSDHSTLKQIQAALVAFSVIKATLISNRSNGIHKLIHLPIVVIMTSSK